MELIRRSAIASLALLCLIGLLAVSLLSRTQTMVAAIRAGERWFAMIIHDRRIVIASVEDGGRDQTVLVGKFDAHYGDLALAELLCGQGMGVPGWFAIVFRDDSRAGHRVIAVVVPIWLVAGLVSLPLANLFGRRVRSTLRRRAGLCVACGYDLRGSAERCPECGREIGKRRGRASAAK